MSRWASLADRSLELVHQTVELTDDCLNRVGLAEVNPGIPEKSHGMVAAASGKQIQESLPGRASASLRSRDGRGDAR